MYRMESSGTWGNNGLTSVNCGGVWGSSGSTLSCNSVWNSSGVGKRTSSDGWPGLEVDSKQDGNRWGSLTSDNSNGRPRNSSPGTNVGASGGPEGENDLWGRSSGHGSSSSWGSASTSDNKDASGWGSLDPSPVPNSGTEGWGSFRPNTGGSQVENKPNEWKVSGDVKSNTGSVVAEKEPVSSFLLPDDGERNASGEQKISPAQFQPEVTSDMQSIWNTCASITGSSQVQEAGNSEPQMLQQQQQQASIGSKGVALERDTEVAAESLSREELIRRAVNSNDGWGKTPVRQDTPWNVDDEPKKPFLPIKVEDISAERNRQAARERSGSLSWNPGSELPMWGNIISNALETAGLRKEPGSDVGPDIGAKAMAASEKLVSDNAWPLRPAAKELDWSSGLSLSEHSWESGKKDSGWDNSDSSSVSTVGAPEPGAWGQTLTRSASASTWSSDDGDSQGWPKSDLKGPLVERSQSVWPSDPSDMQNWKPGLKSSNSVPLPNNNLFNVPPPQFAGDGFGLVDPWSNSVKQGKPMEGWGDTQGSVGSVDSRSRAGTDWNAGDAGRKGLNTGSINDKPPQMRVRLLQQLMDAGFKREEAQAALISNNMNMEMAISKLLANQTRGGGGGLDMEADQASSRLFQNTNHINDLAMLSRTEMQPDVAACLVNLLQNSPNASTNASQLGSHLSGGGGTGNLLRSTAGGGGGGGGSGPQFMQNQLGLLSSLSPNMLPALQQKLLQSGVRTDGSQQAAQVNNLQHQLLQQHLLQNVQGAVQAGLIPPHLITAQSLTPTVLVKLQQMMQMYQALQSLAQRHQIMVQENLILIQNRQRPQNLGDIEVVMTSFKQQICQTQQQIFQELTIQQPPPSISGMDQLLKNFASLQTKDDAFSAAGLMNQWKVSPTGDDSGLLGQMAGSNLNLQQHSISMSASQSDSSGLDGHWMPPLTSCWSQPSEFGNALGSGRSDVGAPTSLPYTSATSVDGSVPSVTEVGLSEVNTSEGSAAALQLEIAEFIPGKPWQGLATKSAEDGPHVTLGSATQGSLILNNDVQGSAGKSVSSVALGNMCDPTQGPGFTGLSKSIISNANLSAKVSPWSPIDSSMTSDPWARSQGTSSVLPFQSKMSFQQQQQQQQPQQQQQLQAPNRNMLWSGADRTSYKPVQPSSPSLPSNWVRLKNISTQVDIRMLEAICEQHGPMESFIPNLSRDTIIIKYLKLDDACKAQRLLNLCPVAGQPLVAEFLNKFEVFQVLQQTPASVHSQLSKAFSSGNASYQGLGKMVPNPSRWNMASGVPFGGGGGGGAMLGGGASAWGGVGADEQFFLPNNKHL